MHMTKSDMAINNMVIEADTTKKTTGRNDDRMDQRDGSSKPITVPVVTEVRTAMLILDLSIVVRFKLTACRTR